MKLHKVIIHELHKPLGTTGAKLSKSRFLMDNSHEDVINLVEELNLRYRRRNEKYGIFDKENPTIFHGSFHEFHCDCTDESFIEFSHNSAENLRDRIEGIGAAKGGYLVYSLFEKYGRYCSVFFVRDTTSVAFKKNKSVDRFDLNKVQHIDFEKLAMACRINMEQYSLENKKYLSFIDTKKDDLAKYFINWISTTDTVSSEEDTKALLKALKKIPLPNVADESLGLFDRDEVLQRSHKHIQANATRTINIHELSRNVFDDENYLPNYIQENLLSIPTEFKAHSTTLRQFVKVYAKADNIELNFYPSAYKEGIIKFDDTDDAQVIIRSKNLVDQLKDSISQE